MLKEWLNKLVNIKWLWIALQESLCWTALHLLSFDLQLCCLNGGYHNPAQIPQPHNFSLTAPTNSSERPIWTISLSLSSLCLWLPFPASFLWTHAFFPAPGPLQRVSSPRIFTWLHPWLSLILLLKCHLLSEVLPIKTTLSQSSLICPYSSYKFICTCVNFLVSYVFSWMWAVTAESSCDLSTVTPQHQQQSCHAEGAQ